MLGSFCAVAMPPNQHYEGNNRERQLLQWIDAAFQGSISTAYKSIWSLDGGDHTQTIWLAVFNNLIHQANYEASLLVSLQLMVLLHVAHSFDVAQSEMEEMVDPLRASSQSAEEIREVLEEVCKRMQVFMAYSRATAELMQHIHAKEHSDEVYHSCRDPGKDFFGHRWPCDCWCWCFGGRCCIS